MRTRRAPLLFVLVAMGLAGSCLPKPQSVRERREQFDRAGLNKYLLSAIPPSAKPFGAGGTGANFGDSVALRAVQLDPPSPRRGQSFTITFYWECLKELEEDFRIFVHGDAADGNAPRIHGDHYPAEEKYPTDVWRKGDIIADPITLSTNQFYGPSRIAIWVGFYLEEYRLPLINAKDAANDGQNRVRAVDVVLQAAQ